MMSNTQQTIFDVVKRMLPNGTGPNGTPPKWTACPIWPADVFAIAASVAHLSSCYAEPSVSLSRNDKERTAKRERATAAVALGKKWAKKLPAPKEVQDLWRDLVSSGNQPLNTNSKTASKWKLAALKLLAISDEACSGIGYFPHTSGEIDVYFHKEWLNYEKNAATPLQLPHSIAHLVPADVACVLPKALTPDVGCTLRSLSHHLALLPGTGVVQARWYIGGQSSHHAPRPLNLLLLPFPYVVHASDFCIERKPDSNGDGYFSIRQNWLPTGSVKASHRELLKFVSELVVSAQRDVNEIHGIVFPEAALTSQHARRLAVSLSKKFKHLEFLVSGVVNHGRNETRNEAIFLNFEDGTKTGEYTQSKHHRWRLDARQIRQYQLGAVLDPAQSWWENIAVHQRELFFSVNRHDAVVATLICEDLARYDPVLPVITSVGPNLLIALLMDGPQMEQRWSGRYATVLAEDPGASVLTLTCAGMIERSKPTGSNSPVAVGLWKDRESAATQLTLPSDHHGIVLTLTAKATNQKTLDGRYDGGNTVEYRLGGMRPIRLKKIPSWLERAL
jgi:hypothetical protein